MQKYPSYTDYQNCLHNNSHKFLIASDVRDGSIVTVKNGKQEDCFMITGGYAAIFKINISSKFYAMKCWTSDLPDIQDIYQHIGIYLNSHKNLSYFVEYKYYPPNVGIKVYIDSINSFGIFPFLLMEWTEGQRLNKFIDENIFDRNKIRSLTDIFLTMVKNLHQNQISHGDLQEENILIQNGSSNLNNNLGIKLIDYDSMYVPTLNNKNSQILGKAAYQSPYRQNMKEVNVCADYFSELVIYLSLLVYAEQPTRWKKGQENHLLFDIKDLETPQQSQIFSDLLNNNQKYSNEIIQLTKALMYMCIIEDIKLLYPLEKVIELVRNDQYPPKDYLKLITEHEARKVRLQATSSFPYSIANQKQRIGISTKKVITCIFCHTIISNPVLIYCPSCKSAIHGFFHCSNCNNNVPKNAHYCPQCGKKHIVCSIP